MRIDLGGPALELVAVGDNEYAAEVDGLRVPIRYRMAMRQVSEGGGRSYDQDWEQAPTVKLHALAKLRDALPTRDGERVVFHSHEDHHYRAFDTHTVTMWFADGVVHVDHAWTYQDDSYY